MLLGASAVCPACLARQTAGTGEPLQTLPIELHRDLVFCQLGVNGSEPLRFLFDTGAGGSVIAEEALGRANVRATGRTVNTGAFGSIAVEISAGNRLSVGRIDIQDVALTLLPLEDLSRAVGVQVDGIVGYDVLSRFVVEHDLDSLRMRLFAFQTFRETEGAKEVFFEISSNNLIYTRAQFVTRSEKKLDLPTIIDSGSTRHVSFYRDAVEAHRLYDESKRYGRVTERGSDGRPVQNVVDTLVAFGMGGIEHRDIPAVLSVAGPNTVTVPGHRIEALVGQGVLARYNVVYDYSRKRMFLNEREETEKQNH